MRNKRAVLLKNLMLETSAINIIKHEKDPKKRNRAYLTLFGELILAIMLAVYMTETAKGYVTAGITESIPALCAIVTSLIALFLTFIKVNGYLFAFKDYDITMSLPIKVKDIVAAKFIYMYHHGLIFYFCISLPMMFVYGNAAGAPVMTYVLWTLFTFILPILPMILAAILGTIVAALGSGFRNKNIIQTIFTFVFVFAILFAEFSLTSSVEDANDIFTRINGLVVNTEKYWIPVKWFEESVTHLSIVSILLLIGVTIVVFELFFLIISTFYRQINSKLMSHAARKNYKLTKLKAGSATKALVVKEIRRFFKSTIYLTNNFLGEIFVIILSVAILFVDVDKILAQTFTGMQDPIAYILPLVPLAIYMFLGMTSTTAVSLSLEGKSFWIVKSLPISIETVLRSKMLFNLLLSVPFAIIGTICLCIGLHASIPQFLLFLAVGLILCCFSTAYGSFCNVLLPKFEWENEVEVVKQSASLTMYLFPNMIITMVLLVVTLLMPAEAYLIFGLVAGVAAILAVIFYLSTMKMAKKL